MGTTNIALALDSKQMLQYRIHHTQPQAYIIRVFCPRAGTTLQVQKPRLQFYQRLKRCGSFPLLSAPHSLFSIWTDFKRSEKIPGAPTWRWGQWIWLTGPSGLHRNSPRVKYQFQQDFWRRGLYIIANHLFRIVVSMSDCHPREIFLEV